MFICAWQLMHYNACKNKLSGIQNIEFNKNKVKLINNNIIYDMLKAK